MTDIDPFEREALTRLKAAGHDPAFVVTLARDLFENWRASADEPTTWAGLKPNSRVGWIRAALFATVSLRR